MNRPNFQHIPIRTPEGESIRAAFAPPPPSLLVDYVAVERWVAAHMPAQAGRGRPAPYPTTARAETGRSNPPGAEETPA